MNNFNEKINMIWQIADLLRGDYKSYEFEDIILPFVVLKRLDSVIAPFKDEIVARYNEYAKEHDSNQDRQYLITKYVEKVKKADVKCFNISNFTLQSLLENTDDILGNTISYLKGFGKNLLEILEIFKFEEKVRELHQKGLLRIIIEKFVNEVNISPPSHDNPSGISNQEMGYVYEELIRKFAEQSNETAGEHFTPREVIKMMVGILFYDAQKDIRTHVKTINIYDPAAGTGGMLTVSYDHVKQINPETKVSLYGQELQPKTYAVAKSDMLIKGGEHEPDNIKQGNSLVNDLLCNEKFNYMLTNPPFGVKWEKYQKEIQKEHKEMGFAGRYGAGLPRVSDGALLFVLHMISKMRSISEGGGKIAVVLNGSPMFTGDAGSGESEIRRFIFEKDLLEAVIALPDSLFYNTGIFTYIWILSNNKPEARKGMVMLIDAREMFSPMRKPLGQKRKEISPENIQRIIRAYSNCQNDEFCKAYPDEFFGYTKVTLERPLRLNFQASKERIGKLRQMREFVNLAISSKKDPEARKKEESQGRELQNSVLTMLESLPDTLFKEQTPFEQSLTDAAKTSKIKLSKGMKKMIVLSLSEKDETAGIFRDDSGNPIPDPDLRDYENIPLQQDIDEYFEKEVRPHVSDAWMDREKDKIGYEINFTKYFYKHEPLPSLDELKAEILAIEKETEGLLKEIFN